MAYLLSVCLREMTRRQKTAAYYLCKPQTRQSISFDQIITTCVTAGSILKANGELDDEQIQP